VAVAADERREVKAVARWVRMSPRKARLVAEHIRGRSVPEARTVLRFSTRAAARELEKVLSSAVANAEANHNLNGDELVVSAAYVDEGPVMKRWRARARGRAARIHKPTCHITVKLIQVEQAPPSAPPREDRPEPEPEAVQEEPKPKRAPAAKKKPAAKKPAPKRKPAAKKEAKA
jgi:large subunit ribosomal protein L22